MKKLLTIALALVMVLALAAPAMATVGFGPQPETTPATATEFSVKITALQFLPVTSGFTFENNYYNIFDPTTGIVAGSDIRFVVDVTFPKTNDITIPDLYEQTYNNMILTVGGNNVCFGWYNANNKLLYTLNTITNGHEAMNGMLPRITVNSPTKAVSYMTLNNYTATPWTLNPPANQLTYDFSKQVGGITTSASYTTTYTFMFVADVLTTGDVTVTASMSALGDNANFAKDKSYTFKVGTKIYKVTNDSTNGWFDICNTATPDKVVRFTVDSKDVITNIAVTLDPTVQYKYVTVEPLKSGELATWNAVVADIAAGKDARQINFADNVLSADAIEKYIKKGLSTTTNTAKLTAEDIVFLNTVYATNNGKWTTDTNVGTVTDLVAADVSKVKAGKIEALDMVTLAGAASTLIEWPTDAAILAEIKTPAVYTAGYGYDADGKQDKAWAVVKKLYADKLTGTKELVIGINDDRLVSSITGYPAAVEPNYTNSVPFLGWKYDDKMAHSEWWNVNKDVRLAEIVFNLNDKIHTDGYTDASQTDLSRWTVTDATHGTINQTSFWWCTDTAPAALGIYGEKIWLPDVGTQSGLLTPGQNATASKDVNKAMYDKLYKVFNEVMTVLDFTWDGTTAYMYRAAFVEKFGGKLSTSASYTYAAYTSALVVADPNAQPPQTGDTTSILGFVMIAVAVLAAGAVVVKKVRA